MQQKLKEAQLFDIMGLAPDQASSAQYRQLATNLLKLIEDKTQRLSQALNLVESTFKGTEHLTASNVHMFKCITHYDSLHDERVISELGIAFTVANSTPPQHFKIFIEDGRVTIWEGETNFKRIALHDILDEGWQTLSPDSDTAKKILFTALYNTVVQLMDRVTVTSLKRTLDEVSLDAARVR